MSSPTHRLAAHLLAIRSGRASPVVRLAEDLVPSSEADAYEIQDIVAAATGQVCGWKVGAASPEAEPSAAPLHADTIFPDGAAIPAGFLRHRGAEAEFAYRFDRDVGDDLSPEAVLAAVGSVHPAIEIVDTRFVAPNSQPRLAHMADQQSHGALILGPAFTNWRVFDPSREAFTLTADETCLSEQTGGNKAGDLSRLLVWLARHAAERGFPIRAGTVATTGSLSGAFFVPHGTRVRMSCGTLGEVSAFLE